MAERMAVPAQFGIELPAGADPLAVAAGMNPGSASWLPLNKRHDQLGERGLATVLVLGATGMSGSIAADNAYALGARRSSQSVATQPSSKASRPEWAPTEGCVRSDSPATRGPIRPASSRRWTASRQAS